MIKFKYREKPEVMSATNARYNFDSRDANTVEKTADRCFKYCIREFIAEHLLDFEKDCLDVCLHKLRDHAYYFRNKSLTSFEGSGHN